jgi:predicted alpha/beta hydrolase family esterase
MLKLLKEVKRPLIFIGHSLGGLVIKQVGVLLNKFL